MHVPSKLMGAPTLQERFPSSTLLLLKRNLKRTKLLKRDRIRELIAPARTLSFLLANELVPVTALLMKVSRKFSLPKYCSKHISSRFISARKTPPNFGPVIELISVLALMPEERNTMVNPISNLKYTAFQRPS